MKRYILPILLCSLFTGCSGKQDKAAPATPAPQPAVTQHEQAGILPFSVSLSGVVSGQNTALTISVTYETAFQTAPVLVLTPHEGTEVLDSPLSFALPIPSAPGTWTKLIHIAGTSPKIDVSVRQSDEHFGAESHATWPPAPKQVTHGLVTDTVPLPHPIEVNGTTIDEGIEVHP